MIIQLNTLHVSQVPLDNLNPQAAVELGRIQGSDPSDPQNPGDQFIYVPR